MLLKRIVLLVLVYQALRLFFLLLNYQMFAPVSFEGLAQIMRGGFRFDMSTIAYFNVLYILMFVLPVNVRVKRWYQQLGTGIFIAANSIVIVANLVDSAYFPFILHRTNAAFFLEFKNDTHLLAETGKFVLSYWYIALAVLLLLWLFQRINSLIQTPKSISAGGRRVLEVILLPVIALVWLGFARGSFVPSDRPINISYAGNYVIKPIETQIVINTPFSVYSTLGNIKVPDVNYYTTLDSAAMYYNPVQITGLDTIRKKNVVIIIVESLSREFIGSLNTGIENHKGYTPFLDSLITKSLVFGNAYANGRRSIEALPSVIASIPSPTEAYVLTPYSTNEIKTIGSQLRKNGYSTSFYHGAHNGSMGFNSFAKLAGFEKTFGMEDYGNMDDYDGTWGIYDEEFLQYWARGLNAEKGPFCSVLFTVSSHHPFKVPEKYTGKFQQGDLPIHASIQYTDFSLSKFFETASTMPWYRNTVFVITADHTATYPYYQEYNNTRGTFSVPIIFFTPDSSLQGNSNILAQQSDIYPTLLDHLGLRDTIVAFGQSLLRNYNNRMVVNCFAGTYQAIVGEYLLQFDGTKSIALYKINDDVRLQNSILEQNSDIAAEIEKRLKAYIQQYAFRVRNNKMLP